MQCSGGDLALSEGEGLVLLFGVGPVLELDHAELRELAPEPVVVAVEQAELLAVRHDLREQHALVELALRGLHHHLGGDLGIDAHARSEEQPSELQSLMRTSYAVFCWKKKKTNK